MQTIAPRTAKQWLDNNEAVLVDVREPAEHRARHIAGATLLPLSRAERAALPALTGRKLVVHCLKGGRAAAACRKLLAEDPGLEIYNLAGGIDAWDKEGLPTVISAKRMLPLDRQVQLAIGVLLLAFLPAALLVSPWFLLGVLAIAAGLVVAGVTGFCALGRLVAAMPWNQASAS